MDYHDMLAHEGIGSAHPGGFAATMDFLTHFPIEPGREVLEIGCGTGRTSCYLAEQGCVVTALDIRPKMIEKAKERAAREGVAVGFVEGDANALTFPDESFDVVLGESVTVFTDIKSALGEYFRVLRKQGWIYDRELMAMKPYPDEMKADIREFYGAETLPSLKSWLSYFRGAGFQGVEVWKPTALSNDIFALLNAFDKESYGSKDAPGPPSPTEHLKQKNKQFFSKYETYHGYGVFMGKK